MVYGCEVMFISYTDKVRSTFGQVDIVIYLLDQIFFKFLSIIGRFRRKCCQYK